MPFINMLRLPEGLRDQDGVGLSEWETKGIRCTSEKHEVLESMKIHLSFQIESQVSLAKIGEIKAHKCVIFC